MKQIQLFGTIGKGFDMWTGTEALSANWLMGELDRAGDVELLINSDGGEVFEAKAMMEIIRAHPGHTTARVMALAASSASFLILSADRVEMAPGAQLMVHEPWTSQMGTSADLRKSADLLDHVQDTTVIPAYMEKTGLGAKELVAMMKAETWIDTDMAIDLGFADGVAEYSTAVAALLRVGISSKSPRGMSPLEPENYRQELIAQLASVRNIPLKRIQSQLKRMVDDACNRSLRNEHGR